MRERGGGGGGGSHMMMMLANMAAIMVQKRPTPKVANICARSTYIPSTARTIEPSGPLGVKDIMCVKHVVLV
jgi:hypothetical protein